MNIYSPIGRLSSLSSKKAFMQVCYSHTPKGTPTLVH
jgi:hypothetical protein